MTTEQPGGLRVLSLGAGVQSSTLLLMACEGEIEKPDVAIFADTQWEPKAVYRHLDWLTEQAEAAGIPIERVTAGDLRSDVLAAADQVLVPAFVEQPDGGHGMMPRKCTRDYKIRPLRRAIRRWMSERGASSVEQWLGISLDEATRMKPSDVKYISHRYPLIERRLTRHDCINWLAAHGYDQPPKSACIGCPFHSDQRWRALRDEAPDEWRDAVAFDEKLRERAVLRGTVYLHRSRQPLREVDLSTPQERGQLDLFDLECEGMCGV